MQERTIPQTRCEPRSAGWTAKGIAWTVAVGASLAATQPAQRALPPGPWAADRQEIRSAGDAARYAVRRFGSAHHAPNPSQRWLARFDGLGVSLEPRSGSWSWGLELERWGFADRERWVAGADPCSEGQRMTYRWSGELSEWYINDVRGVEHGYTVHRRPETTGDGSLLSFWLRVRGSLSPQVARDGRSVTFVDTSGLAVLRYAGLVVFDADGARLPARLASSGSGLALHVEERGARYPLTIDPVVQEIYLKASNADNADWFGDSVAVSGDTIVVGALHEDSRAVGVNGNQADNGAVNAGAAYVFVRSGATWTQQAYLKASNTDAFDNFGSTVAVCGDTIVVGAPHEDSGATSVNGSQGNGVISAGAAYVFVRRGTTWSQQAYLKASNAGFADMFGSSVAVSGDTVVVGAPGESSIATGVNGSQGNGAIRSGAAYVFVRRGTVWTQQAYLKASNTDSEDGFGRTVAVSGETIVAGAPWEASAATGVNGNQASNATPRAGAAYVFRRAGGTWSQEAYLKATNTDGDDFYGSDVGVSGDTIAVGASGEASAATGFGGNQADNSAPGAGAVYVYGRQGAIWSPATYIKASNAEMSDHFGEDLALAGDLLVVGASGEDSNAVGINGNQQNNSAAFAGAAYLFGRCGGSWQQLAYLKASNAEQLDRFSGVGLFGETIVVGASGEASNARSVGGPQGNNLSQYSGAAYVFEQRGWNDWGGALGGAAGAPLLVGTGTLAASTITVLDLMAAAPSAPVALLFAGSSTPVPVLGGTIKAAPVAASVVGTTSAQGALSISLAVPFGVPAGTHLWVQGAIIDPAAPQGLALSNALQGIFP